MQSKQQMEHRLGGEARAHERAPPLLLGHGRQPQQHPPVNSMHEGGLTAYSNLQVVS